MQYELFFHGLYSNIHKNNPVNFWKLSLLKNRYFTPPPTPAVHKLPLLQ